MVKRCNYPSAAVEERLVRDRFVVGLRDSRLSDQLCRHAKLTPQDAWTQARQSQDAGREKALPQNRTEHSRELNLDATKALTRAVHIFCKKKGHFGEVCGSRKFKQYKLSSVHLHAVATPAAAKFVDVTVDDYTTQFEVDSGAEVSAVPSDFPALPNKLDQVDTLLTGPRGQPLRVPDSYVARLQWQAKASCQCLYVIQSLTVPLLGLPALKALQGIRPDPGKVEAVKATEAPMDVAGVKRLLGMVNHLARFLPHISDFTAPDYCQTPDSSLSEQVCELVTETEQRYSQTEKEALATTWTIQRFEEFNRGIPFNVESDHLPLVSLLGKMELDMLPPSIQILRLKTMRYQFPQVVGCTSEVLPLSPKDMRQAQESDGKCKALASSCQNGWLQKTKIPLHLSKYASVEDELSICDGVLLKGAPIVIPSSLRPAVLTPLHECHQDINRTKALARESVWWPGISADIASFVANCEQCTSSRVDFAEPLLSTGLPGQPWEFLGMGLFKLNDQTFILVVDYYSRFPGVVTLRSTTAQAIDALIDTQLMREIIDANAIAK
ncbi:uncharacterized protein [Dermacentor albipictus]|uniref:uncharacterized protein n=1 Tax=Dermacentor albipictus TaxID=60249 RepID=UPI0038FBF977